MGRTIDNGTQMPYLLIIITHLVRSQPRKQQHLASVQVNPINYLHNINILNKPRWKKLHHIHTTKREENLQTNDNGFELFLSFPHQIAQTTFNLFRYGCPLRHVV